MIKDAVNDDADPPLMASRDKGGKVLIRRPEILGIRRPDPILFRKVIVELSLREL